MTKKVKGADIKAALELGLKLYPELNGAFPHVSGIACTFDPSESAGGKVTNILIRGKPLDMNQDYVLATNDFMAAGGDGYTMLADDAIVNEYSALDEAVIRYIQAKPESEPQAEGRIVKKSFTAIYIVKPGDALWWIAKQYGTTWEKLQAQEGLELIEIAPGIDLEKDILPFMDYKPIIKDVKTMPKEIFREKWGGLVEVITAKKGK